MVYNLLFSLFVLLSKYSRAPQHEIDGLSEISLVKYTDPMGDQGYSFHLTNRGTPRKGAMRIQGDKHPKNSGDYMQVSSTTRIEDKKRLMNRC
jgi:hypothetical protein